MDENCLVDKHSKGKILKKQGKLKSFYIPRHYPGVLESPVASLVCKQKMPFIHEDSTYEVRQRDLNAAAWGMLRL